MGLQKEYKIKKEPYTSEEDTVEMYVLYFLYVEKDGNEKWVRVFSTEPIENRDGIICGYSYGEAIRRADKFIATNIFFESMI